jgi:hypothetical protein
MRTLMQVHIPVERGNEAVRDGALPKVFGAVFDRIQPEAAYFTSVNGERTAIIVFDMPDASAIPAIVEPLFMNLDAAVELAPCMNRQDLEAGIAEAAKNF